MASKLITSSSELTDGVLWPGKVTDTISDMAQPIDLLLIDIGICPKPEDMAEGKYDTAGNKVPASVAIIEAGATEFSESSAKLVKWAGGVFAVGGTALAFLTAFWTSAGDGVRAATIGGTLLVVAAVVIALSVIVSSDVRARGVGAAAQYQARAQVADAYLHGAALAMPHTAPEAPKSVDANTIALILGAFSEKGIQLKLNNGDKHITQRVRLNKATGELEVQCGQGVWCSVADVAEFQSVT